MRLTIVFPDPATARHFVLAPDETIGGVSEADGKFKKGTLFKVKTDGTGFVDLHDFYGGDDDGEKPMSLILAPDGSLIGTLERKVFHYDPKSQQYALVTMNTSGNPGPSWPAGFATDGSLVGFGGMYGSETSGVVSMAPDGGNYLRLENGQSGKPLLQYSQIVAGKDGTFFAISTAQGKASVVKFKTLNDTPTLVHKFAASPTDGNRPDANLVLDNKGNLYGSTSAGGMSQNGVIYRIDADGSNYQVVYNPDEFAFTKVFVAGDDGMLYGISKDGLLQLAPDGSGKPPTKLVAFQGDSYLGYRGATPNVVFHNGAIYGLCNKAIYKVILPEGNAAAGSAMASVSIQTIPPAPPAFEAITFTEPVGTASAGPAGQTPSPASPSPQQQTQEPQAQQNPQPVQPQPQQQTAQQPAQQQPQPQQQPQQQQPRNANDALNRANNAANQLRGLFGK